MKKLIVIMTLFFTSVNAFADYACTIRLSPKQNPARELTSMTLFAKKGTTALSNFGSEFYQESRKSTVGFTHFISGWQGDEQAKLHFFRTTRERRSSSPQSQTLTIVELHGEQTQTIELDQYQLNISCTTQTDGQFNEVH